MNKNFESHSQDGISQLTIGLVENFQIKHFHITKWSFGQRRNFPWEKIDFSKMLHLRKLKRFGLLPQMAPWKSTGSLSKVSLWKYLLSLWKNLQGLFTHFYLHHILSTQLLLMISSFF